MEPDAEIDTGPDLFGAHEKWVQESGTRMRWAVPIVFATILGVISLLTFALVLANPAGDQPVGFGFAAFFMLAALACLVRGWLKGTQRIEVDQRTKTLTWSHSRPIRPRTQSWHFDQITGYRVLDHVTEIRDRDRGKQRYDEYFVRVLLTGGEVRLFGSAFDQDNSAKVCRQRMQKLIELTGKPEIPWSASEIDPELAALMRKDHASLR